MREHRTYSHEIPELDVHPGLSADDGDDDEDEEDDEEEENEEEEEEEEEEEPIWTAPERCRTPSNRSRAKLLNQLRTCDGIRP